jgi:hypothetical protein
VTVLLSAVLLGGMPSGLVAFLQADMKGWRPLIGCLLALGVGAALVLWAALDVEFWSAETVAALDRDRRVLMGGMLAGVMVWAVLGAIIGKVFERSVNPVTLGLRTAIVATVLQIGVSVSGIAA